ncbi:hypothetical protein [Salinimicrobium soli]|uniref:hypothetical protein n=1 Tax=Salinimicrobium soli TaxID=1254399 RepID=UPI003AAE1E86
MKKQRPNLSVETRQNTRILFYWTMGWVLSLALVSFGPTLIWGEKPTINLLGILLNLAIGIGMIFANIRHLNGLDELQRKIQLEAMAVALGVAVVAGISYSMLDVLNLITFDAEISHLVILVGLTYLVTTLIGNSRYQ